MQEKTPVEWQRQRRQRFALRALLIAAAAGTAGCSAAPSTALLSPASPSYLGAAPVEGIQTDTSAAAGPRVSSGKVLTAIVFERVTGREVDPARLVDR